LVPEGGIPFPFASPLTRLGGLLAVDDARFSCVLALAWQWCRRGEILFSFASPLTRLGGLVAVDDADAAAVSA
jgi:hypothetical protein